MSHSVSQGEEEETQLKLSIPTITAESEIRRISQSPEIRLNETEIMDEDRQTMSIRKRRNLSKNRGQAARQREKTPEPSRTLKPHEDTPTSDDEEPKPQLPRPNSREIEADSTYEEMKRLVQEKANVKDPVYDLDTDEVLEQRAMAAQERRRRSISPFALPDKEEIAHFLERKGSFVDPTNKLLSTNYALTPKDEDTSRRNSLTIEPPREIRHALSTPSPVSSSPKEVFPFALSGSQKKIEEVVHPDEKKLEEATKKLKTPIKNEEVFTFEDKDIKKAAKTTTPKPETPGELVTKVIQLERTPSRKVVPENKSTVEVRERIVRTPSRRLSTDIKPIIVKQQPPKQVKDESQSRAPPIKPARSKSASRFGVSFFMKLFFVLFVALLIALYFHLT